MSESFFHLLLRAAILSATLRVYKRIGYMPDEDDRDATWFRRHPYLCVNDDLLGLMAKIGRLCRDQAKGFTDAQRTPFWPLLENQDRYREAYEFNQSVVVQALTPSVIYERLKRGSKILWNGWHIYVAPAREARDDFGNPVWASRIWVVSPDNQAQTFARLTEQSVYAIYHFVTGEDFKGVDMLSVEQLVHRQDGLTVVSDKQFRALQQEQTEPANDPV